MGLRSRAPQDARLIVGTPNRLEETRESWSAFDVIALCEVVHASHYRRRTKATARACELVPAIAEHGQALSEARRSQVHRRMRDDAVFGLAQPDELRQANLKATAPKS